MKASRITHITLEALQSVDLSGRRVVREVAVAAGHRLAVGFVLLLGAIVVGLGIASTP